MSFLNHRIDHVIGVTSKARPTYIFVLYKMYNSTFKTNMFRIFYILYVSTTFTILVEYFLMTAFRMKHYIAVNIQGFSFIPEMM